MTSPAPDRARLELETFHPTVRPGAFTPGLDLGGIASGLKDAFKDSDAAFLSLGASLGEAIDIFAILTSTFEALPAELDNDAFRDAANALRIIARNLSNLSTTLADERAALLKLKELSGHMGARVLQLRQTIHTISILAVNAQIAAASIRTQDEGFAAFTAEIARLTHTVEGTVESYFNECQRLAKLLDSAVTAHSSFGAAHRHTLNSVAEQLKSTIEEVDARRLRAAGSAIEIGMKSAAISRQIGVMVQALQIGDITRQRIEHVCLALDRVDGGAEDAEAFDSWDHALTEVQKSAVRRGVAGLQAKQLAQTSADFQTEIDRIAFALRRLVTDASGFRDLGREMFGTGGSAAESFLQSLEGNLKSAKALVQQYSAARAEVNRVIALVTTALSGLLLQVNAVKEIEADMRLVGLNMGLKCTRLGQEGQVLRAIAQELRTYAHQILGDASSLISSANDVVAWAEELNVKQSDQGEAGGLDQQISLSLDVFDNGGVRLSQALATLAAEGARVERILGEAADHLSPSKRVVDDFMHARNRLEHIAGAEPPLEHGEIVTDCIAQLMKKQYTMASERNVHLLFERGPTGQASNKPEASTAPASAVDAFLF